MTASHPRQVEQTFLSKQWTSLPGSLRPPLHDHQSCQHYYMYSVNSSVFVVTAAYSQSCPWPPMLSHAVARGVPTPRSKGLHGSRVVGEGLPAVVVEHMAQEESAHDVHNVRVLPPAAFQVWSHLAALPVEQRSEEMNE